MERRTYAFVSSVLPYTSAEWEKLSIFLNLLTPKLPAPKEEDLAKGILEAIDMDSYLIEVLRDTLENWQSEFLQLRWQVAGLAFLFYVGSPQSKEGDDRKEEKLDRILKAVAKDGEEQIKKIDKKYARS